MPIVVGYNFSMIYIDSGPLNQMLAPLLASRVAEGDLSQNIHVAGSNEVAALLRALAAMQDSLRGPIDLVARLGGEEFVALMPHAEGVLRAAVARTTAFVEAARATCAYSA